MTMTQLIQSLDGSARDKAAAMKIARSLLRLRRELVAVDLLAGNIDDPVFVGLAAVATLLQADEEVSAKERLVSGVSRI